MLYYLYWKSNWFDRSRFPVEFLTLDEALAVNSMCFHSAYSELLSGNIIAWISHINFAILWPVDLRLHCIFNSFQSFVSEINLINSKWFVNHTKLKHTRAWFIWRSFFCIRLWQSSLRQLNYTRFNATYKRQCLRAVFEPMRPKWLN